MALDNAEFISELSIVDPPGTDPLNQGDDHIRTTKKAVQQSFPNVGSAVPQSGAQMAQMAIKNEVNTFTAQNVFDDIATFNSTARFNFIAENIGTAFRSVALAATNNAGILWIGDSATLRWDFIRAATNTSGDLQIDRYDGNGTFQDVPFRIAQSSGEVNFGAAAAVNQQNIDVADFRFRQSDATLRWLLRMDSDGNGNNFVINRRSAGGVGLENTLTIIASNGSTIWETNSFTQRILAGQTQLNFGFENTSGIGRWGIIYSQTTGALTIHSRSATGSLEGALLRLEGDGTLYMDRLPTGPTANTKEIYAKQSQLFAPTELVLGQTP